MRRALAGLRDDGWAARSHRCRPEKARLPPGTPARPARPDAGVPRQRNHYAAKESRRRGVSPGMSDGAAALCGRAARADRPPPRRPRPSSADRTGRSEANRPSRNAAGKYGIMWGIERNCVTSGC